MANDLGLSRIDRLSMWCGAIVIPLLRGRELIRRHPEIRVQFSVAGPKWEIRMYYISGLRVLVVIIMLMFVNVIYVMNYFK